LRRHRQLARDPGATGAVEDLPRLLAFVRCAVDVRTIDVAAASARGVLVTHASAGFAAAVAEWTLGAMIDLARGITASTLDYRAGRQPPPRLGVELRGSTLGLIGYGARSSSPVARQPG
jgi:D-3-phosphoglycerate dehydrogenase